MLNFWLRETFISFFDYFLIIHRKFHISSNLLHKAVGICGLKLYSFYIFRYESLLELIIIFAFSKTIRLSQAKSRIYESYTKLKNQQYTLLYIFHITVSCITEKEYFFSTQLLLLSYPVGLTW